MDYGFHHNLPLELRLTKATKALPVVEPEPVLRARNIAEDRIAFVIDNLES
jgi:hypothetical protein